MEFHFRLIAVIKKTQIKETWGEHVGILTSVSQTYSWSIIGN